MSSSAERKTGMAGLVFASLVATIPVWLPHYPMMADLPQHAAEIAMVRNLHSPDFPFARLFEYHWFTPYLFGYLLPFILAPMTGIVVALKIVISAAVAGIPISTAVLLKEAGADSHWAWLSIPAMYGFAYQWGLLNFVVAVPVGILFLAFIVRHSRTKGWASSLFLIVLVNALFFCHALICALVCLISVLYLAAYHGLEMKDWRKAVAKALPLFTVIPTILCWYRISSTTPLRGVPLETVWDLGWFKTVDGYYSVGALFATGGDGWGRISGFLPRLLGVRFSALCLLVGVGLFALPFLSGARLSRRPSSWVPLSVLVVTLLLLPHVVLTNAYTYQRLTVFALPFFVFVLADKNKDGVTGRLPSGIRRIAIPTVALAWIAIIAVQTKLFDSDQAGFQQIMSKLPQNQRVLSMIIERDDGAAIAPVFMHFGSWYTAQKAGLTDPSFAMFGIEPVLYKLGSQPPADPVLFSWNPGTFDWKKHHGNEYRYFLVRYPKDAGRVLFRTSECPISLRAHEGHWWLYEKDANCQNVTPAS